jgi:tRNA(fMet)-specific endonuclease VapC
MDYLLDTNILSDLEKNPRGSVARVLAEREALPDTNLQTSIIVACEVRFGVQKKDSRVLAERMEQILGRIKILPLETGVDEAYARVRTSLERKGEVIGANDMLIAAHAMAVDAVLVTDNVREFSRVDGLKVENWLRPGNSGGLPTPAPKARA